MTTSDGKYLGRQSAYFSASPGSIWLKLVVDLPYTVRLTATTKTGSFQFLFLGSRAGQGAGKDVGSGGTAIV